MSGTALSTLSYFVLIRVLRRPVTCTSQLSKGAQRGYCGRLHSERVAGPASEPRAYDTKTHAHDQLSPLSRLPEWVPRAVANTLLAPAPHISPGLL